MKIAEKICQEASRLPDSLAREVLNFIEFIEAKHGLRDNRTDQLKLSQTPAMHHVWDNQEDEVWNDM